jgi:transcriptional regulator with XRE-family HTH domain
MGDINIKCLMTQSEIAEASGRSQASIHYILNGDRTPSIDMALSLEHGTGICREAWLFPERHWNPYIPFENIQGCATCPNRFNRIMKSIEVAETYFEKAENKREAFKDLIEIYKTYTGINQAVFVWRELVPEGLKLLACSCSRDTDCQPVLELLPKDPFKRLYKLALNEQVIVIPNFPLGIVESGAEEINLYFKKRLKSKFSIARGGLFFSMYSDVISLNWSNDGVKHAIKHVERISKLWQEYRN